MSGASVGAAKKFGPAQFRFKKKIGIKFRPIIFFLKIIL